MKTIFDLEPTDAELADLFGSAEEAEHDRPFLDADTHLALLAQLMALRGQDKQAWAYAAKITDPSYRLSTELSLHDLAG